MRIGKSKSEIASEYAGSLSWVPGNLNEANMGLTNSKGDLKIIATILLNVHTTLATSLFNIPGASKLIYRSKVKCDAAMLREYGGSIPYITKINVSKLHSETMSKLDSIAVDLTSMGKNIETLYNEKATADNIKTIIEKIKESLGSLLKSFEITSPEGENSKQDGSDTSNQDQKHKPLLSYSNVARELNNIARSVKEISTTLENISNKIQIPKIEKSNGMVLSNETIPENIANTKKDNIANEYYKVLSYVIPNITQAIDKLDQIEDEYVIMMILLDVHTSLATSLFQFENSKFTTYSAKLIFKPAKYRHKNYKPATCLKVKARSALISKSLKKLKDLASVVNTLGENIGLMEWEKVTENLKNIGCKLVDTTKLNTKEGKSLSLLAHPTILKCYERIGKLLDKLSNQLNNKVAEFKDEGSDTTAVIQLAENFISIGNYIRTNNYEKAKQILAKISDEELSKIDLKKITNN